MQRLQDSKNIDDIDTDKKIPIRLAFIKSNGVPSVISLWYVCIDGKIYCATQRTAKIILFLQNNQYCCFEIAADKPPYKGVRGEGTVKILNEKGQEILDILIEKYLDKRESILSKFLRKNSKTEIAIEVTPQKLFNQDYSKRMKDV